MIDIKNLNYKTDNITIFENAQLYIPKGKTTIIAGLNGSGKTTLLKIIAGIIKPQKIEIKKECKELFYLPQKIKYPTGITLFDYVESSFYRQNWKWFLSKEEKNKINNILETLDLTDKKDTLIDNLSSGELQKANIALGLLSNADLLLLDEPTSNMDIINQVKVLDIIDKLKQKNITSVIVMHDINLLSKYGDYFAGIIKNSEIITGYKKDFISAETLKKVFGINFKVDNNEQDFNIQICN